MILVMNTAAENVFIGIWDEKRSEWINREEFIGGRELNSLIIKKLDYTLSNSAELESVVIGIIVAAGPGSFTGLRIGMSVANALAYTLDIPIVAVPKENDPELLLKKGQIMLKSSGLTYSVPVVPFYGAEPNITKPKK